MIEQLHIDQSEGFLNLECGEPVIQAGFKYTGRVIMGQDHKGGHAMKSETDQQSNINHAGFHTADVQHSPTDDLLAVIEEDHNKLLLQGQ